MAEKIIEVYMRLIHLGLILTSILLLTIESQAQRFGGTSLGFRGMSGYAGFGVAEFSVLNPSTAFRMDQGVTAYLGGEKEMGKTGLFITFNVNYMSSDGQSFYDYTALGGSNYATNPGTEINFSSTNYQLGIGLKFKLFPTSFFRPYGEGGGLFGYHEIEYKPQAGQLTNSDGGYKSKDGLTGFGYYVEAGVEIDFSKSWGIRTGVRYQITETRPFETLGNEKVKFESRAFQFGIARNF